MRIDIIPKHFFPPSGHIKGEIETREISQEIPSLFIGFEKKNIPAGSHFKFVHCPQLDFNYKKVH